MQCGASRPTPDRTGRVAATWCSTLRARESPTRSRGWRTGLSSLHTTDDARVFDKVVVITDRVVLDRQLQDTISQFEHAVGVVQRIDESSAQLAEALTGEQARIIVTTLQKFPHVFDRIDSLPERSYAVIVDEAHSSQTGEAAKELRRALGSAEPDIDDDAT